MSKHLEGIQRIIRGELPVPPVARLIGFQLTSVRHGESVIELEASDMHANPMGTLHGGILCDIADAAMGIAFASTLEDDESFTTLELKINFLRPVWKEKLRAIGKVVAQAYRAAWRLGKDDEKKRRISEILDRATKEIEAL